MEKIRFLDLSQNPFKDGRFKKLSNDKRAKVRSTLLCSEKEWWRQRSCFSSIHRFQVSAVVAYIAKNAPKTSKPVTSESEATETKASDDKSDEGSLLVRIGVPNVSLLSEI